MQQPLPSCRATHTARAMHPGHPQAPNLNEWRRLAATKWPQRDVQCQGIQQPNSHDEEKLTGAAHWRSNFVRANVNHGEKESLLGGCGRGCPKVMDMSVIPAGHSHPFGSGQQLPPFATHNPLSPGTGVGLAVCSACVSGPHARWHGRFKKLFVSRNTDHTLVAFRSGLRWNSDWEKHWPGTQVMYHKLNVLNTNE